MCIESIADTNLWSATISWYDHGEEHYEFPQWCYIICECITEREAVAERRGDISYYDSDFQHLLNSTGVLPDSSLAGYSSYTDTSSSGGNRSNSTDGSSWQSPPTDHLAKAAPGIDVEPSVLQDQCGNSCTTNKDCNTSGKSSCMCSAQSEQYQPGSGTVAFVAACIISMSGKREESMPCPCNGSYVSHGCCGSEDGVVWEAEEFKLGELLGQTDLLE